METFNLIRHKLINKHNEISNVTTDTTAEVIYQAILEHEKLLKDPIIFDIGFSGNSSISHVARSCRTI